MLNILMLYSFWASFALIGFVELKILLNTKLGNIPNNLNKLHLISRLLVYFTTGLSSFILVILPLYVFELKLWVLIAVYFTVLLVSLVVLLKYCKQLNLKNTLKSFKPDMISITLFMLFGVFFLLDLINSNSYGGIANGDAQFELARITLFRFENFGLKDAIFGERGIPVTVYSANIIHAFHALIGELLDKNAAWTWYYSHGIFRVLTFAGIFTLTTEFLKTKQKYYWSYAVLLLVPLVYSDTFLYIQIHYNIVVLWTAIFIVGIKWWLEDKGRLLLFIGAILLATSHPLNAVIAFGFVLLLSTVLVTIKKRPNSLFPTLACLGLILSLPIMMYFYYPHGITDAGFNDRQAIGSPIEIRDFAGIAFNTRAPNISPYLVFMYIFFGLASYIVKKYVKNILQRRTLLLLIFAGLFILFNMVIFSLIGLAFVFSINKDIKTRTLIILLATYAVGVAYNPVVLTYVLDRFPIWTVSKFYEFNVLAYALPIIGSLWLVHWFISASNLKHYLRMVPLIVVVFWLMGGTIIPNTSNNVDRLKQNTAELDNYLDAYSVIDYFRDDIANKMIFSNNLETMARVPTTANANAFHVFNEANVHPNIHFYNRKECAQVINSDLKPEDIKASEINAILADESDTEFLKKAQKRENLMFVKSYKGYSLFYVKPPNTELQEGSVCKIPETLRE